VKASKASIGRAVDQPDPKIRFYLFLGHDDAQSRGLASRLLQAYGAQKATVAATAIKANPGLLIDEAAALSLFGERRLIWIEPAGNEILEGVEALLAAGAVESPVAAIAGALPKSSPLLKATESSQQALAFTAYAPEGDEAARMVADLGRRVGLKIAGALAARIADTCGNDQGVAMQELEKLALYAGASPHSPKELDQTALEAVGAQTSDGDVLGLADLALLGDVSGLARAFARLPGSGSDAVPAIRSLQRRILLLAPARARIERGERIDGVMTSMGKTLFWKDKAAVEKMLGLWSAEELAMVFDRTGALERSLMFSKAPPRESLAEEFLTIARRARRSKV
jgi:DNA polymerase III subunit delta